MRITKLSLTNFRSFKHEQTIEFAPITLLVGPNSVGKSTVLMALFYLQQIIEKGQCNPYSLEVLGNKFVGGYKNLVHRKDLSKNITFKVEYAKDDSSFGSSYDSSLDLIFDIKDRQKRENPQVISRDLLVTESPAALGSKFVVELEIKWSPKDNSAFVCRQSVWIDNVFIAESVNEENTSNARVNLINYFHPYFLFENDYWYEWYSGTGKVHPGINEGYFYEDFKDNCENQEEIFEVFGIDGVCGEFHDHILKAATSIPELKDIKYIDQKQIHPEFQYKSIGGVLSKRNKVLSTSLEAYDLLNTRRIEEVISDIFVATLDNIGIILKKSICIGPLRHIPDANYHHNAYPKQEDWYDGKACWDIIKSANLYRDVVINKWLVDKNKLNLGYKLVYKTQEAENRYISPSMNLGSLDDLAAISDAVGEQLKLSLSKEDIGKNPDAKQTPVTTELVDEYRKNGDIHSRLYLGVDFSKGTTTSLWDCNNNIEVSASDIGVGVSQLLPIVVASQTITGGFIACEQPELHVHPRVQVAIGDLLIQSSKIDSASGRNKLPNFLIETHSEHLILRLRRRIRETADNELPEGLEPLLKEDISIAYLEPTGDGVTVKYIDVDEDGEFTTDWPDGFFPERREELF